MTYTCEKTYGHELGLSACFRQWRAKSHCSNLHGYALSFRFVFGAKVLDECGWVLDFGALKPLKESLVEQFDHKLLVAADDPMLEQIFELRTKGIAEVHVWPDGVGCERFAAVAYKLAQAIVDRLDASKPESLRRWVIECECREHGANSATYKGDDR